MAKVVLLGGLVVLTLVYLVVWVLHERQRVSSGAQRREPVWPTGKHLTVGFLTNFFDALGIGSFATTTSAFKQWRLVPDQRIPGTLNVGHTVPAVVSALVFIAVVEVELRTLFSMIAAACAGAWLGADVVSRWSRRRVQIRMGTALFGAAAVVSAQLLNLTPSGRALALDGPALVVAVIGNALLGALMTLGVGLYAPCMVLVSLLGMDPAAAFPIMMGSVAFLMPVASIQFVRRDAYDPRAAMGLTIAGPFAVLLAVWLVASLDTSTVRMLVLCVLVYTASTMLRSAALERRASDAQRASHPAGGPALPDQV